VARVLIYEPHDDVAALLAIVLKRLGHEPLPHRIGYPAPAGLDAAVIEPGDAAGRALADELSAGGVPLVFTSIYGPTRELLDLRPLAWLVKPFPLRALGDALAAA
jgi:hypothetical protein